MHCRNRPLEMSPQNEPNCIVGFQKDSKLQERQRKQQRVENKAAKAPKDLRDKLNAGKRARDLGEQSSSNNNRELPAPSPTQPEARRQKMEKERLTSAETQQLDITAKDVVRLQSEKPVTTEKENPLRQKFQIATGKRHPATQRTIEKATVGVLYIRPVKGQYSQPKYVHRGSIAYEGT